MIEFEKFLLGQLDYVLFVYALSLFVIAALSFLLTKNKYDRLEWVWLGIATFFLGSYEFMTLISVNYHDSVNFFLVRVFTLLVSYILLLEFVRSSSAGHGKKVFDPGFYVFVVFAMLLIGVFDIAEMNLILKLVVGVPAIFLAAWAFNIESSSGGDVLTRGFFRAMSSIMLTYAVITLLLSLTSDVMPMTGISNQYFYQTSSVMIQFFRAVSALLLAAVVMSRYVTILRWRSSVRKQPVGHVIMILVLLTAVITTGWAVTQSSSRNYEQKARNLLLTRAKTIAATLDMTGFSKLSGKDFGDDGQLRQTLLKQLMNVHFANEDCRSIYLLVKDESGVLYYEDTLLHLDKKTGSSVNSESRDMSGVTAVFDTGKSAITGPYSDRWGQWITAVVPITEREKGRVMAVLGFDMDGKALRSEIALGRLISISFFLVFSIIIILSFIFWEKYRASIDNILWNEGLLKLMSSSSPLAFYVVDAGTDKVLYLNDRFCQIWGFTLLKQRIMNGLIADREVFSYMANLTKDPSQFKLESDRIKDVGNREILEDEIVLNDGRTIRRFSTQIRDRNDEYFGRVFMFEDITERKKLEEDRMLKAIQIEDQLKRIQELSKVKSEFASAVSHELRTPLTSIKDGISIVLDGSSGPVTEQQKEFLGIASRNVSRLEKLVNHVLDISKLEGAGTEMELAETDLAGLIASVIDENRQAADQKGLSVVLEAENDVPKVFVDRNWIRKVLNNLVRNAIKFTDKGEVKAIVNKDLAGKVVTVCIKDSGKGIPKDSVEDIFGLFRQLGGVNERKTGGAGLGLAICREVVGLHGGNIWAESEEGKGSSFCFTLPI